MTTAEEDGAMTPETVLAKLESLRAKRGYLLPHHGLMAVGEPDLLAAYDQMYSTLTLGTRILDERTKEIIWLVVLTTTSEAIATHHIQRMHDAGGTDGEIEAAVRLAAYARGADYFDFVRRHWGPHLADYDAVRAYRDGLDRLAAGSGIEAGCVEMALAAAHACQRRWGWVEEHIIGAYRKGVAERALLEAFSLMMFPGGIPNFVDAAAHWRQLILDGRVAPSPAFDTWARAPGQGGFDEASGSGNS
ncbi:MAG: carboxymuconolactone decarboxylase family protein [Alphaproteobacteria bacterium]|jgi:alkylhydroperoxidase/carboxymuconolactone decarboxylase family protein YurZ|nr:carboxymuconolactone decarboxylase family protein [Alphaproteobacteria bacterium]